MTWFQWFIMYWYLFYGVAQSLFLYLKYMKKCVFCSRNNVIMSLGPHYLRMLFKSVIFLILYIHICMCLIHTHTKAHLCVCVCESVCSVNLLRLFKLPTIILDLCFYTFRSQELALVSLKFIFVRCIYAKDSFVLLN